MSLRSDSPAVADNPGHRKVVAAASLGNLIEVYDLFVYGYFATILAEQYFPRQDPNAALLATFAIFAVGFCVRPVGAVVFGHIGDRLGRRAALTGSLLLMTASTVAFGLLPTYAGVGLLAPVLLLLCRIVQGLSASAEVPGAIVLILEHAPARLRGRLVGINNMAGNLGTATAAAAGLVLALLLPPGDLAAWGWRVAFLAAAPIGLVGLYIRLRLLDSPVFLALGEPARRERAPLFRAFATAKSGMLVFMAWTAVTALGAYLTVGYLPSYLIRVAGFSRVDAFTASLVAILCQAGTFLVGGYLVDRFPLRRVAIAVLAGLAVTVLPGFWIITEYRTVAAAVVGQVVWGVFVGAAHTVGTTLTVTLFPAAIRFTATAVAFNVGITVFGGTAPYVSTWLVSTTHSPIVPGVYLLVVTLAGLLAAAVGLPARPGRDPRPPAPADGIA